MAAELRWILLGLSLPLLAGIWWWTARRSGQAPGNAELRESTAGRAAEPPPALDARYADSQDDESPLTETGDWSVSPFEPLSIHTAGFDHVPVLDGPMMVDADPAPSAAPAESITSQPPPLTAVVEPDAAAGPASAAAAPGGRGSEEPQRIVTIRVCTVGEARWSGGQLMAALELHGLAFGRYQVFHRKHVDGRSLFCAASLIEPGTFDIVEMPDQEFRGVTLFAVLPGPSGPLETIDEMFDTARGMAEELSGMIQDSNGMPMSPQRAAALREDVARFQALLPGS